MSGHVVWRGGSPAGTRRRFGREAVRLALALASSFLAMPCAVAVREARAQGEPFVTLSRMAPARPGHFAEREELDAALKSRTRQRLILFIERHPSSRYRPEAEAALRRLDRARPRQTPQ